MDPVPAAFAGLRAGGRPQSDKVWRRPEFPPEGVDCMPEDVLREPRIAYFSMIDLRQAIAVAKGQVAVEAREL